MFLVLLVVLGSACWIALRGYYARSHLLLARTFADRVSDSLRDGDVASARRSLDSLQRETASARSLTNDPVWRLWGAVPRVGATVRALTEVAAVSDAVARRVLPPLADAATELDPARLRIAGNQISTQRLTAARTPLRNASDAVGRIETRVVRVPRRHVVPALREVRDQLVGEVRDLMGVIRTASLAADVAPGLLGAAGPQRYFVAFQNNAEARATGGLVGAFAILEADRGRLRLVRLGSSRDLRDSTPVPAVDLGPEFQGRYGRFYSDSFWRNSNMSAHFPYAAALWAALWQRQTGERVEGALAVDPVAMSAILDVTGSTRVSKSVVATSRNVVALTESAVYRLIADDEDRDRFLQVVARAIFDKFTSGAGDPRRMVRALARAAGERHIQFAATDPAVQRLLAATPLAGVLPEEPGPFLHVVTQDAGGSKLDYYTRRRIGYDLGAPRADGVRVATVTVRLRNTAPKSGLPAYVVTRADLPGRRASVPGQALTYVSVYGGVGASLLSATVDGRPATLESHVERGHAVFSEFVTVDPGREVVLRLVVLEPVTGNRSVVVHPQPLVAKDEVRVRVR